MTAMIMFGPQASQAIIVLMVIVVAAYVFEAIMWEPEAPAAPVEPEHDDLCMYDPVHSIECICELVKGA